MSSIAVLDHGFVKLRNISGPVRRSDKNYDADDTDPATTARISFDNMEGDRTRDDDLKLVKYLIDHNHNTPIEMIEVWLEMKMPIFVARQFVRHRTACINEVSGRYVTLPEEWYIPEIVGGKPTGGAKQGQSDTLNIEIQNMFKTQLQDSCYRDYQRYLKAIEYGVAPEHARMFLHTNHYTHWVWKQDLHNVLHFLKLRLDGHAQVEAQLYGGAIFNLLYQVLPQIMVNFEEGRGNG